MEIPADPPDVAVIITRIEDLVRAHKQTWDEGRWNPAHDEMLWKLTLDDDEAFPADSIPPEGDFVLECAKHQICGPHAQDIPDLSRAEPEERLDAYRRALRAHRLPRGHDLCWEHHARLYAIILPELRGHIAQPGLLMRMQFCLLYRQGLNDLLAAQKEERPDVPASQ